MLIESVPNILKKVIRQLTFCNFNGLKDSSLLFCSIILCTGLYFQRVATRVKREEKLYVVQAKERIRTKLVDSARIRTTSCSFVRQVAGVFGL